MQYEEGPGRSECCLPLHIKKGKDHFDTFNSHFVFAQFLIILHLNKKGRCRLIQQTDALTLYNDWEVRRLGMRDALKHGTITVSGFRYFHKNCRFLWGKNVSKANLGRTIHYTYMSYNKYIRLCMVSEEMRLNEIGLFLQQYRFMCI